MPLIQPKKKPAVKKTGYQKMMEKPLTKYQRTLGRVIGRGRGKGFVSLSVAAVKQARQRKPNFGEFFVHGNDVIRLRSFEDLDSRQVTVIEKWDKKTGERKKQVHETRNGSTWITEYKKGKRITKEIDYPDGRNSEEILDYYKNPLFDEIIHKGIPLETVLRAQPKAQQKTPTVSKKKMQRDFRRERRRMKKGKN